MQNLLTFKVREYRLSLRGIYCTLPKLRNIISCHLGAPWTDISHVDMNNHIYMIFGHDRLKSVLFWIFLCDNLFIVCFISSSLVGCVKSWHTYGAASCHAGHLHHRPNLGAGLGGTGRGRHSNMEKVAGRTSYILTILCSGLDSILSSFGGRLLLPLLRLFSFTIFILVTD